MTKSKTRTTIEWTEQLRIHLYIELLNAFGPRDDTEVGSRGKPVGMSKREFLQELDDIGVLIGVGAGKSGAIANQLAWAYATPGPGCHQGHWNNMRANVKAATIAGYLGGSKAKTVLNQDGTVNVMATTVANHVPESGIISKAWSAVKAWFS